MSSRSTSPDPITTPYSPTKRQLRSPSRSKNAHLLARHERNLPSPARSALIKTEAPKDQSPWQIKVTVQAEPKDGSSPLRSRIRTVTIPIESGESADDGAAERNPSVLASTRKTQATSTRRRKRTRGTPTRRSKRIRTAQDDVIDAAPEADDVVFELSSPLKQRASTRLSNRIKTVPTERTRRLGVARRQLDQALDDAVGHSDDEPAYPAGEMTIANEDFTMISPNTLATLKNNTSMIEDDQSAEAIPHVPSPPPHAETSPQKADEESLLYPQLPDHGQYAQDEPADTGGYDAMSWKPTGPAKLASSTPLQESTYIMEEYEEPSEWQHEREMVIDQINNARTEEVIVIEEETRVDDEFVNDEDIWAEEASRSLEEEQNNSGLAPGVEKNQVNARQRSLSPRVDDLFANQPLKPPRGKIPRTWRRSSGVEFSYVDSPELGALAKRAAPINSSEAGHLATKRPFVPTPPSSDRALSNAAANGDVDAAPESSQQRKNGGRRKNPGQGTQTDKRPERQPTASPDTSSPGSLSERSDETGVFWQPEEPIQHPRKIFQPNKTAVKDLSELLGPNSPEKLKKAVNVTTVQNNRGPVQKSEDANMPPRTAPTVQADPREERGNTSMPRPQRRQWGRNRALANDSEAAVQQRASLTRANEHVARPIRKDPPHVTMQTVDKPSDRTTNPTTSEPRVMYRASTESRAIDNESGDDSEELLDVGETDDEDVCLDFDHSHSYEEHLNLESPQKIQVRFNDSVGNSSLLLPQREYEPLFGDSINDRVAPAIQTNRVPMNLGNSVKAAAEPSGIIARLSNFLQSAMTRPVETTKVITATNSVDLAAPVYHPGLRAHIRSRYGVLAETHPWTMAHMRTLHRMVNSCTSNKSDSIIPRRGALPKYLASLVNTEHIAVTDFSWIFTEQHAHVVHTFMQVLVSKHFVDSMANGEVDFLGDHEAKRYRAEMGGRHGRGPVWEEEDMLLHPLEGSRITMTFVSRALGNVVLANILTAERDAAYARGR